MAASPVAANNAILVVGPSWVGDLVMAHSLLQALLQRDPVPVVDVLAPRTCLDLLCRMPGVRHALELPFAHGELALRRRRALGRSLRGARYRQAIVLPNSFKSALVPWFARIPLRTGWRGEMRHGLLNDLRRLDPEALPLMVQRFAALAHHAGEPAIEPPRPVLVADGEQIAPLRQRLGLGDTRPVLALCPGAEFGASKRWPPAHFRAVAAHCIAAGWQVWLFGAQTERAISNELRAGLEAEQQAHCFDLCGKTTLADAVDLLSCARMVLSNDSGLMHVAAALNRPLVVVYGSSSAAFTPPLCEQQVTLMPTLDCAPCFERECRFGHYHCLYQQTPARAIAALSALDSAIPLPDRNPAFPPVSDPSLRDPASVSVIPAFVSVIPASVSVIPASVSVIPASVSVIPAKAGIHPQRTPPPRVLLLKTSSLGDLIHTLPALSDAAAALPGIRFDWVAEEALCEIPAWHPAVANVIPVALRRWRGSPWTAWRSGEWQHFRTSLRTTEYDLLLDAQGLLKSALLARLVDAPRAGFDRASVRESLASLAYQRVSAVPRELHAIERTRMLFASQLGYPLPASAADFGIDGTQFPAPGIEVPDNSLLFLHGSAQARKCLPQAHWRTLCERAAAAGCTVLLAWGDPLEKLRAEQLAGDCAAVRVLPPLGLTQIVALMQRVRALVAVDTGLGHLAAALDRPCLSLYGPTRTALVGTRGARQLHLCAPSGAMSAFSTEQLAQAFDKLLALSQ